VEVAQFTNTENNMSVNAVDMDNEDLFLHEELARTNMAIAEHKALGASSENRCLVDLVKYRHEIKEQIEAVRGYQKYQEDQEVLAMLDGKQLSELAMSANRSKTACIVELTALLQMINKSNGTQLLGGTYYELQQRTNLFRQIAESARSLSNSINKQRQR